MIDIFGAEEYDRKDPCLNIMRMCMLLVLRL